MAMPQYSESGEQSRIERIDSAERILEPGSLLGTWLNTNSATGGMASVVIARRNGALTVRVLGADEPTLRDWGEVTATVYAKSVDSMEGMAFGATYDFRFMKTHLQANVKQGVLVIAGFTEFKDDSRRANYFVREFFHRQ